MNHLASQWGHYWPVILCLALAGCGTPPAVLPDDRVVAATGLAKPIRLEIEGGQLDTTDRVSCLLTLPDAVARSLHASPQLQAAMAKTRAALAESEQARLLPNPVLNVSIRFPEAGGKSILDAGLAADLIALLQRPRRASAADHRLRAASAEVLTVALDVVAEVQERYAAVQASEARLAVLSQRRTLLDQLVELARARLRAGETGRLDVLVLETERVQLEAEIEEQHATRTDERLVLARLIGQPSADASWQVSAWELPAPLAIDERGWIAAALKDRPEVQTREWELAALGDDLRLSGLLRFDGAEVGLDSERDENWSVGPAVSTPLPIFDTGKARRDKAQAELIEARHRLTETRRQVVEDVRRALASLAANRAALKQVRSSLIPLLEQRREQAEAAYRTGLGDITPIVLAEQQLQDAKAKSIELQLKAQTAGIRVQRAVGGGAIPSSNVTTRPAAGPTNTDINNDGSAQ